MLKVENLAVSYGHHQALYSASLKVTPGEVVTILGANGAGKSTLLKAIGGLVPVTAGTHISFDGQDLLKLRPDQIVEQGIAFVPEGRGIFTDLTVRENLELGAYAQRARGKQQQRYDEIMDLFPRLSQRLKQLAGTMSGGEQQMVAIGRALMSNPELLLLDEPSLGLSPLLTSDLFKAISRIRSLGVSVLLVEQNARKSLAISQRGYLLANGKVVGEGSAQALAEDATVQQAYLGSDVLSEEA